MKKLLLSLLQKAKVLTIFYYGFKELILNMRKGHKKKPNEGLKRQALKVISTLPWLNAATDATTKQRLELMQSDGEKHNAIDS